MKDAQLRGSFWRTENGYIAGAYFNPLRSLFFRAFESQSSSSTIAVMILPLQSWNYHLRLE